MILASQTYSFQQSNIWKVSLPKSGGTIQKKEKEHYQKRGTEKMIAYCEIRKCNIEKSTSNCAECNEYKCEKLEKFIELAPPVGEALEALRKN